MTREYEAGILPRPDGVHLFYFQGRQSLRVPFEMDRYLCADCDSHPGRVQPASDEPNDGFVEVELIHEPDCPVFGAEL